MTRRRKYKHRPYRPNYKPKYFFSEKDIDFTKEYLDYEHFLLQEFFNADLETKKKIFLYYEDQYGSLASGYLKRKYKEWAIGKYHLTDLMRERIVFFMPKFLSKEAKHRLALHDFMASIKKTVKYFWRKEKQRSSYFFSSQRNFSSIDEIINSFENEYDKIENLNLPNFQFGVLTTEEKIEVLELSKYILKIKLQNEFDQIERDFNIFLPFMFKFKRGKFSATYDLNFFGRSYNISETELSEVKMPKFQIPDIIANSRFRKYADKYLAYELVEIDTSRKKAAAASLLNENDLMLFYKHYEELLGGDREVEMNSVFQGEGGILRLNTQIKPLGQLGIAIMFSAVKLLIYMIILLGIVSWAISNELYLLLIFGGLYLGVFAFSLISEEFSQLKSLTKELKQYGQQ